MPDVWRSDIRRRRVRADLDVPQRPERARRRVRHALTRRRGEPDRVPTFEWLIDHRVIDALCPGCDLFDFVEQAGLDAVVVYDDGRKDWLDGNTYVDEWGITMALITEEYPIGVDFPL